MILKHNLGL